MSFLKHLRAKYQITAEDPKLDTKKLDDIVKAVEKKFHDEYDCDYDQDGYFQCSKHRQDLLEDEYHDKLTDEEYAYCEEQLNALQEKEDKRNNPYHR